MGDEEEQYELGVGTGWTSMSPTDVGNGLELYTPPEYPDCNDDDYPEDIYDGLEPTVEMNTEPHVPEGWFFNDDPSKLPQTSDVITVRFTPLELNNLMCMLKSYAVKCDDYDEQGICRDTITDLQSTMNTYAVIRPWTPFLKQWLKTIDRYKYRQSQTGEIL